MKLTEDEKRELWHYLCKEASKLQSLCAIYQRLANLWQKNNDRYGQGIVTILHTIYCTLIVRIPTFVDRGSAKSLLALDAIKDDEIKKIKKTINEITDQRHRAVAHSGDLATDHFPFFTHKGITMCVEFIAEIQTLLSTASNRLKLNEEYWSEWIGPESSIKNLIDDAKLGLKTFRKERDISPVSVGEL